MARHAALWRASGTMSHNTRVSACSRLYPVNFAMYPFHSFTIPCESTPKMGECAEPTIRCQSPVVASTTRRILTSRVAARCHRELTTASMQLPTNIAARCATCHRDGHQRDKRNAAPSMGINGELDQPVAPTHLEHVGDARCAHEPPTSVISIVC